MAEARPPYETLLDYLVYAPIGAALVLVDEVPRLAARGRGRVEKRVALARLVGRFAAEQAGRRLGTVWSVPAREQPVVSGGGDEVAATKTARSPSPSAGGHERTRAGASAPAGEDKARRSSRPATHVPSGDLPIPAYDTLAASQVVERLASLTSVELEAVRRHEAGTRRRRTVLHKIAQLSAERDNASA